MFVRKKKNRSGTTSVVVVDKFKGKFKELNSMGAGRTDAGIEALCLQAKEWIKSYAGQLEMDFAGPELKSQEKLEAIRVITNIDSVLLNGTQLLLNGIYDSIGFNGIKDEILRNLVIAGQASHKARWQQLLISSPIS